MNEESASGARKVVVLGHIAGLHGVRGWVRIHSLTEPREVIFEYQPWLLGEARETARVLQYEGQGKRLIARLDRAVDREQAEALVNCEIAVYRDQLPPLPEGRYYWTDLVGLSVRLEDGTLLGTIERMLATGANDVMVVRGDREHLVPFVPGPYVKQVDLAAGEVIVDWDPDF